MKVKDQGALRERTQYESPKARVLVLPRGVSLLEPGSFETDVEEFGDGGEL